MSSKRVRIILLTGIALIVLVVSISLILTFMTRKTTTAALPEAPTGIPAGSGPPGGGSLSNSDGLKNITVTIGNVQAVVATLSRPESYTRLLRCENFYAKGSAVYTVSVTVTGGSTAMTVDGAGGSKKVILAGGKLYIWYDNDKDYRMGPADALGDYPGLSDEFQMIPTYEDISRLDKGGIRDAGFVNVGGEDLIYLKYVSEGSGTQSSIISRSPQGCLFQPSSTTAPRWFTG